MTPEPAGELPRHIGSGAFRVDRARMLEKLTRFQLADAAEHVLAFARAAVASNASRVDVATLEADGYELLFDGAPFTKEELRDPYGLLFESAAPRGRFLAAGLLGAFQLGAHGVSIAAAAPEGALEMVAGKDLELRVGPAREPSERNRIRVWGLAGARDLALELLSARCARSRVPFSLDGRALGAQGHAPGPEPSVSFEKNGMRGRAWMRCALDGASRVALSIYGVEAEHATLDLGPAAVGAEVDDDRLALDAAQSKVIHDERWQELKFRLRDAAQTLLAEAVDGHRRRLRAAGKALLKDPALLRDWRAGMGAAPEDEAVPLRLARAMRRWMGARTPRAWSPERSAVVEEAARTRWLRQTAILGLKGWHKIPQKPSEALTPLWTAPVFLDWRGRSLSFLELRTALVRDQALHVCTQPWTGRRIAPVVWQLCIEDRRALELVFPGAKFIEV